MTRRPLLIILCLLAGIFLPQKSSAAKPPSIVPKHQQMKLIAGSPFSLNATTNICYQGEGSQNVAKTTCTFSATPTVNGSTIRYTKGCERHDTLFVDKDIHHGFTGGSRKNTSYRINAKNYETGASFKIKAKICGNESDDSNGVILIRKGK